LASATAFIKPEFDSNAADETQRLILAGDADRVVDLLARYEPRTATQRFEYEARFGWARQIQGDYRDSIVHMLRALRFAGRDRALRVQARHQLAWTFLRSGDFARAERQLRRALAEIRATGLGAGTEPGLLNTLAALQRRRGMLADAVRTYEQALALPRDEPNTRYYGIGVSNLALALMRAGDFERAGELLRGLPATLEECVPPVYVPYVHLSRARLALSLGDLDGCEMMLGLAKRSASPSDYQTSIRTRVIEADLENARGRPARARALLDDVLPDVLRRAALNDSAPEAARVLAVALHDLNRLDEALEKARLASSLGRYADVLEWAGGLRIAGQCLAALGRRDEGLAAFEEARSVLRGTDCVVELQRLEETARAAGIAETAAERAPITRARGRALSRLRLRDGRVFLTHDLDLIARIHRAANDRLPVLIVGETGTGKELVAHLLHELSARASGPLVVVDCATVPEGVAEAELFGAARGAYSGAVSDRPGLIAGAHGGTLFFDELPELSLPMQAKLLRLLQEGTYRRVGENSSRSLDARIIAATNRDPEALLERGALKPDLLFRLDGHRLTLSPLRGHRHEVAALAHELARGLGLAGLTPDAAERLQASRWPGNVRQLEMLFRVAAASLGPGARIDASDLEGIGPVLEDDEASPDSGLRGERLAGERRALQRALESHHGNVAAAARSLSMSRQGFYKALRRTGLM
jgi:anaerobic nitric oxide reductase transcription regulator